MSYILEALKKLEEKRRAETIPNILTGHDTLSKPVKKRPVWPYFIMMALLLNAGLLLWWLQPWRAGKANVEVRTIEPRSPQTLQQPLQTLPPEPLKNSARQNRPLPAPSSVNDSEKIIASPDVSASISESAYTSDNKQQPAFPSAKSEQKPVNPHELPPSMRQELPDLVIAGHFYDSNPASRLVIINGRTLREG
jgi:general secretion pathway protein B